MYKVKILTAEEHPKKKNKIYWKKSFAKNEQGQLAEFSSRRKARQWIWNHLAFGEIKYIIVHPDGTEEKYIRKSLEEKISDDMKQLRKTLGWD